MKRESVNKLLTVSIFAIAFGFVEAAVVVYLRALFYPNGFTFPLVGFIDQRIIQVDLIREFATIVMLVTVAILAGKKLYDRFAYFIYAFAIWDIFYYVFLKLILNWPPSFLTWDVLFLIPLPWIGPVVTPIICSLLLIIMSFLLIKFIDEGYKVRIKSREWFLFIIGTILVLFTWLYDYIKMFFERDFVGISSYIPRSYNWAVFIIGLVLAFVGIVLFYIRTKKGK